jgi:hypothetical protein
VRGAMKSTTKANKLHLRFSKALSAAGPLKMFVAWAFAEMAGTKRGKKMTWDKVEIIEVLDLSAFPKKGIITEVELKNKCKKLIDLGLDDLLKEVLWAIVNQPLNREYCYTLGIACGLMMGKGMEKSLSSARIALPGVMSRRKTARDNKVDIQQVLKDMNIKNDLRIFRTNKELRDNFVDQVNQKIKKRTGYKLTYDRIKEIARSIL